MVPGLYSLRGKVPSVRATSSQGCMVSNMLKKYRLITVSLSALSCCYMWSNPGSAKKRGIFFLAEAV